MIQRKLLSSVWTAVLLAGCAIPQYVVLTDVPPEPSITVIPASGSCEDAAAVDLVTGWAVASGVRTLARPVMMKTQADYSGTGSASGMASVGGQLGVAIGGSSSRAGLTTSVDAMSLLDSTSADYVIYVRSVRGGPNVTLVRKASRQVLFAGNIPARTNSESGQYLAGADNLRAILIKAGILARASSAR